MGGSPLPPHPLPPPCCRSGPLANPDMAQGPTWCRDLRSVCSAGQVPACTSPSSYPSCSSGAPSYSRDFQLIPSNVRPPPGLDNQGNFSSFLLCPQVGPLADAHKGLFMGSTAHHLLLHWIFYAKIPQSIFTDKCHCLPLPDGMERKAQKLKWFSEGRSESQSRGGNRTQNSPLPSLSPATPRQSWEQPASLRTLPYSLQQHASPLPFPHPCLTNLCYQSSER